VVIVVVSIELANGSVVLSAVVVVISWAKVVAASVVVSVVLPSTVVVVCSVVGVAASVEGASEVLWVSLVAPEVVSTMVF
jgi:hypothetical protein